MNRERLLAAVAHLITPVGVLDDDVVERNLQQMAEIAATHRVRLRPHAKTHKCGEMARRQVRHGAVGVTAATLTEAEVFVGAGIDDLLIAHPPVGAEKLRRLGVLADRVGRLAVSLDDVGIAKSLPAPVEVLWEIDPGQHRVGTLPGDRTVGRVLELIEGIGAARFRGLITHAGHSYAAANQVARYRAADDEREALVLTADLLRRRGIEVRDLSLGSTPTAGLALDGVTEMRPGTYIYGDANNVTLGARRLDDCALGVVASVVSTPAADRAVLDAGSKAIGAEFRVPGLAGYGMVVGREDLTVARLSEEHAVVTAPERTRLSVGDRLVIIPAHACTTVNLHPALLLVSADDARWLPTDARGWQ